MQVGLAQCVNKGMQRDYSMDKASQEFAYENRNIRITTNGNNSFLSVTNEKSTIECTLDKSIEGVILGSATIGDYIVLFVKNNTQDSIYRIKLNDNTGEVFILYQSTDKNNTLNFNTNNPIECITVYEADDVQKVYWVDGLNQPRVINICTEESYLENTSFDFTPNIEKIPEVIIDKQFLGTGNFISGTIQYIVTYYNKYNAETNVVYISPLHYISPKDRGGKVDENINCSFHLTINGIDTSFTNLRVYSLHRGSVETSAFLVQDLKINGDTIEIEDLGRNQEPVDPTSFLFSKSNLVASTIEQKDNTLFLGNIVEKHRDEEFVEQIKECIEDARNDETIFNYLFFESVERFSENPDDVKYYGYTSQLNKSSDDIKFFKFGETYRFGIQFQDSTASWTEVFWLCDLFNNTKVSVVEEENSNEELVKIYKYPSLKFNIEDWEELQTILASSNYKYYKILMVEPTINNREVIAQGFVNPSVYNLLERTNATCYSLPSWSPRFVNDYYHNQNVNKYLSKQYNEENLISNEISSDYNADNSIKFNYIKEDLTLPTGTIGAIRTKKRYDIYKPTLKRDFKISIYFYYDIYENGEIIYSDITHLVKSKDFDFRDGTNDAFWKNCAINMNKFLNSLIDQETVTSEIAYINTLLQAVNKGSIDNILNLSVDMQYFDDSQVKNKNGYKDIFQGKNNKTYSQTFIIGHDINEEGFANEQVKNYGNNYFVDSSVFSFWSPEIHNLDNIDLNDLKIRLVGKCLLKNNMSDYSVEVDSNTTENINSFRFNFSDLDISNNEYKGLKSFPLMHYGNANSEKTKASFVTLWNKQGSLSTTSDNKISNKNILKSKTIANLWYCDTDYNIFNEDDTNYFVYPDNVYFTIKKYTKDDSITYLDDNVLYKGDYNSLIYSKANNPFKLPIVENTYIGDTKENLKSLIKDVKFIESSQNDGVPINFKAEDHAIIKLDSDTIQNVLLPKYYNEESGNIDGSSSSIIIDDSGTKVHLIGVENVISKPANNEEFIVNNAIIDCNVDDIVVLLCSQNNIRGLTKPPQNLWIPYCKESEDFNTSSPFATIGILNYKCNTSSGLPFYDITDLFYSVGIIKEKTPSYWNDDATYDLTLSILYTPTQIVTVPTNDVVFYLNTKVLKDSKNNRIKEINATRAVSDVTHYPSNSTYKIATLELNIELNNFNGTSSYLDIQLKEDNSNYLWLAEIYRDLENPYETSEYVIENQTYIPVGKTTPINTNSVNNEGDTYFQRWDSLCIYPNKEEDINKVVDIISVPLETHINLDGRSDINRGRTDIINSRPENTNVINTIYSKANDFITYNTLSSKYEDNTHPTLYAWSLSKQSLSDIDLWTKINLSSSAKLDGDKGPLTKIKRWNNQLLAFQDKGISAINFNNQTTITSQEGIPVEIGNSGKVTGHYYLTTTQGCKNKWSIVESPYGLYFIDSYNKSINVFGSDGIKSLSTINLFEDWIRENEKGIIWNPNNTQGFKSFYDSIHKEVYFVNDEEALCYNELLHQFTSFYDYGNMNTLIPINGHMYGIKDTTIYKMFEGVDYCNLFGEPKDYSITYKINKEPFIDKTWTNIEYRADIFNSGNIGDNNSIRNIPLETFDTLEVWNEYQKGITDLSKAKCKFRIWRADIPRDTEASTPRERLNRIRNPWIMLKLSKLDNKRMEFHDLLIKYLQ